MFKKITQILLACILLLPSMVLALDTTSKIKINNTVNALPEKKLVLIKKRIDTLNQSEIKVSSKNREILNYLSRRIDEKLVWYIVEPQVEEVSKELLTDAQYQQVEEEVMKIQNNIISGLQWQLDSLMGEFDRLTHVQGKGDLNMTIDFNHEDIWSVSGEFNLVDYIATNNGFDSQLETDISAFMKVDMWWQQVNFDMSAFIDYITKDGNIYVLMKDLNISESEGPGVDQVVEMMQAIADKNEYIRIDGVDPEEVLQLLENFHPDAILGKVKILFDKPLLKAHTKIGDKYILVPTKYACDQGKKLQEIFDPFYASDICSEGQYEDLVEEFLAEGVELYMTLWNNTTLGFNITEDVNDTEWNIVLNDSHILSSYFTVSHDSVEVIDFDFKRSSHLDISIIEEDALSLIWESKLDYKNNFKSAIFDITYDEYGTQLNSNITFNRGRISGVTSVSEDGEEIFTLSTSWNYRSNYIDIKNTFLFAENPFESSFNIEYVDEEIEWAECYDNYYWDEKYICYVDKEPSKEEISGNLDITIDTRSNKNNLDLELDVSIWRDEIIKMQLRNTATRKFGDFEIETPSESIPFEEVLEDLYDPYEY